MLQIVLLAGKFVFLLILFLFIYRVIRSTTRELRSAARAPQAVGGRLPTPPPGGGGSVWTLVVQKSPSLGVGEEFPFALGTSALAGRSSETDIPLNDTFVSSKHVLFESTGDGLQVEDLRSTNGTQVNGVDIAGAQILRSGDRVEIGDTIFKVELR